MVTMPISVFLFQARKQETKQSVKRDERKGENGFKTESATSINQEKSPNKNHKKHN